MTELEQSTANFNKDYLVTTLPPFEGEAMYVEYNHSNTQLVACSENGDVRLFNIVDDVYTQINNFQYPAEFMKSGNPHYITRYCSFSPDGTLVVVCSKLYLVVLTTDKFTPVFEMNDIANHEQGRPIRMFTGVKFSPDSNILAIGMENKVELLDVRNNFIVESYKPPGKISQIVFHKDNMIFGGFQGVIQTIDRKTGHLLAEYNCCLNPYNHLRDMSITPNGLLFVCLYNLFPLVLNPDNLTPVPAPPKPKATQSAELVPAEGAAENVLMAISFPVFFAVKHINPYLSVTSGGIHGYRLWNMLTFEPIFHYTQFDNGYHSGMADFAIFRAFSPNNQHIALCCNNEVRIIKTPMYGVGSQFDKLKQMAVVLKKSHPDFVNVELNDTILHSIAEFV